MSFIDFYMDESILVEISADDKYEKQYVGKLEREIFNKALALDPTSNGEAKVGQYVDWIIKNKAWDNDALTAMLDKHNKKKNLLDPEFRDINKLSPEELLGVITKAEESGKFVSKKEASQARKKKAEEESTIVLNNENYVIVNPHTTHASKYYGSGSDWCTARQKDMSCMFDDYNSHGEIYIVLDKKTKDKYQLFVDDNGSSHEYRNSANEEFDPAETFSEDLLAWMKEKDFPEYTNIDQAITDAIQEQIYDSLPNTPDEIKQALGNNAREYAYDQGLGVDDLYNLTGFESQDLDTLDEFYGILDKNDIDYTGIADTYTADDLLRLIDEENWDEDELFENIILDNPHLIHFFDVYANGEFNSDLDELLEKLMHQNEDIFRDSNFVDSMSAYALENPRPAGFKWNGIDWSTIDIEDSMRDVWAETSMPEGEMLKFLTLINFPEHAEWEPEDIDDNYRELIGMEDDDEEEEYNRIKQEAVSEYGVYSGKLSELDSDSLGEFVQKLEADDNKLFTAIKDSGVDLSEPEDIKKFVDAFSTTLMGNKDAIQKGILNSTKNLAHKYGTAPMSVMLRKRLQTLPYMDDTVDKTFRQGVTKAVDYVYNDLISKIDKQDKDALSKWTDKHGPLEDSMKIETDGFLKYFKEYVE